jgi:predicted Zn-dependent protease
MNTIKRPHFLLVLLYLILFTWMISVYQSSPAFQTALNIGTQQTEVFIQNGINRLMGKKPIAVTKPIDQEKESNTLVNGARWTQPSATVYVDLSNPVLRSATESAISQWNQTGAFTFHQTNNKNEADIVVTAISEQSDGAAGLTDTKMDATTGYILHADVNLNAGYLLNPTYGYSQQRIINTAEHELGHAIGLQHSDAASVMQPAGSFYSIQPRDVQAVKKLYSDRPQPQNSAPNNNETTKNFQ